jgi:glycosidase
LLAEASALDPYYLEAEFDAAYDWTQELGRWAWTDAFAAGAAPAAALADSLRRSANHPRVFRFLNNNDTRERFVIRHGVDRFKAATAFLLTLPGIPCLYMGDEAGAEFQPYGQREPVACPTRPISSTSIDASSTCATASLPTTPTRASSRRVGRRTSSRTHSLRRTARRWLAP